MLENSLDSTKSTQLLAALTVHINSNTQFNASKNPTTLYSNEQYLSADLFYGIQCLKV